MAGEDIEHRVIQKDYSNDPSMDFAFLRSKGIELIQKLSGKHWTDFNIHDPGVTILEILCYAITDLAYRTDFSIADLLTNKDGLVDYNANSFVEANKILSTAPVSINDFRKLVIDEVPEVVNAWFQPILSSYANEFVKGSYQVIIKPNYTLQQNIRTLEETAVFEKNIIEKVRKTLAASRTIGEDFDEFIVMKPQFIEVKAQLIIRKSAVPEELLAQVYNRITKALSDHALFYTEQELKAKSYSIDQVYNGPLMKNGIIPDDELKEMKYSVDASELVKSISDMTDVLHIRMFEIKDENSDDYGNHPVKLDSHHYPVLKFNHSLPDIKLYHDHLLLPINASVFFNMLLRLQDSLRKDFVSDVHASNAHRTQIGLYKNVEEYTSIQELFPAIYRIGKDGMERNAPVERKAHARQLKAYLLFYEQILAGYLAQLSNISTLFSTDITVENAQTYFFQPLYMVPDVAPLIKAFTDKNDIGWPSFTADENNDYIKGLQTIAESDETFRTRKNQLFDHLLSRFNIVPDKYPVLLFEKLYNAHNNEERVDEVLKWKSSLLRNVSDFNYYRTKAFDYFNHELGVEIRPGFESNIRLLLYIQNQRKILSHVITSQLAVPKKGKKNGAQAVPNSPANGEPTVRNITIDDEQFQIVVDINTDISSSFQIRQQPADFLQSGIIKRNYRVIPDFDNAGKFLIIYKSANDTQWKIIRQYADVKTARLGLKQLINSLLAINIESEGFHVIEHLLLAPLKSANVFGFTFLDDSGHAVIQQAHRVSFYEREEIISKILSVAEKADKNDPLDGIRQLQDLCKFCMPEADYLYSSLSKGNEAESNSFRSLAFRLIFSLKAFNLDRKKYFPKFEFNLMHWDGTIIPEDFYNAQLTVVFPSWPVRFQQHSFRQFAENLIRNNLPVHIKSNFLWLNFSTMKKMEAFYFRWLDSLKDENPNLRRMESILFVAFLYNELKQV